ncbi:MAG: glycosyltransferase [Bauldia litoralis]
MDAASVTLAVLLAIVCLPYMAVGAAFLVGGRSRARFEDAIEPASCLGEGDIPPVLIQIPCFNEEAFVERAIQALAGLDWPRDKLRVQVLDDSTDDTTRLAERAAAAARQSGIDVTVVHRKARRGYKAGALHDALGTAAEPFVAILDVDYEPPRDWLDKAVGALIGNPGLAYVQFRIDFANRSENWVTRAQAVLLDGQNVVEQTGRAICGVLVPFGGTGGVWRREAIEGAGGWQDGTIAEDMDLSYRAAEHGWTGLYLGFWSLKGHLPSSVRAWQTQQLRWATGGAQVVASVLRRLRRTAPKRWSFAVLSSLLLHILEALYAPLTVLCLAFVIGRAIAEAFGPADILLAVLVYLAASLRVFWLPLVAQPVSTGKVGLGSVCRALAGGIYLGLRLAVVKAKGMVIALSGGGRHFVRTPK